MTLSPYLCVADGRAAIDWYVSVFGATVTTEPYVMDDGRIGHAELSIDGAGVMLSEEFESAGVAPPDPARGNPVTLYLEVPDVDGLVAAAVAAGAQLDRGPQTDRGVRLAVLHDPFGHRWYLEGPPD